ncbi:MAG: glycoside hydrolase family 68 protein [Pseudomonadota bacterium]
MAAPFELRPAQTIAVIADGDVCRVVDELDLWDSWPIQHVDGSTALIDGREYWMALTAPIGPDAEARHHHARIRLLERTGANWRDCGDLLPDGMSPGSREWSGSAIYHAPDRSVTLYFTATGYRDEETLTFSQRIFKTVGTVSTGDAQPKINGWSEPEEALRADDDIYMHVDQAVGAPGKIKAFRDPSYFRDPSDNQEYLLFTGSLKHSNSDFNGVVGIAKADGNTLGEWSLLPPLVTADKLNNELERPHLIARDGCYYLFWSTHSATFAPDGPIGPTGLYGMVADHPLGPYRPLNGTGLVAANPPTEPSQGYSWLVLDNLEVTSFVDYWGLNGRSIEDNSALARKHFGGAFAPFFKLTLNGDSTEIVQ